MTTVAVIDYGMGNLHSVAKAVARVAPDADIRVTGDPDVVRDAERVIFPGVGAIRDCMVALRQLQLDAALAEVAADRPLLAICVGMQALMSHSEENDGVDGLGLIAGTVRRFPGDVVVDGLRLKVPHMGWNEVWQQDRHPLWDGIADGARFYFVHSYHVQPERSEDCAAECRYAVPFAAALARGHVFATQFHPEKSQQNGLRLLGNFMRWNGENPC